MPNPATNDNQRVVAHFCKISSGISSKSSSSQKSSKVTAPFCKEQQGRPRRTRDGPSIRFSMNFHVFLSIQNPNIPILVVNINHIPISVELLPCEVHHQNTSLRYEFSNFQDSSCWLLLLVSTCYVKGPDQCERLFPSKWCTSLGVLIHLPECFIRMEYCTPVFRTILGDSSSHGFFKWPHSRLDSSTPLASTPTWDPSSNLKHS